ncbi:error-prone DNA polymerase [Alkalilimnicola ehrlichii MLHE-1]|uniref:Error-prone DNA polymerase n=1 Tax=Alkalilimnicola ehrlichii (strain ATCC BAA-1101 / DSM 17681 / MLHE-1) TaxID=187272 RepID=DNAE2_ALKEH|nr:error-prone DNA polymerase [Alkalilimnicola ehrlichii]Q0A9G3.1 RecName: Full=Error-prone DNA polymerase [Alkalilimnicola ehrlichii MLHE-1]ABI56524.1 error-prone DNA polymerase, DnaE-like protein [Alkalilimnicola ehrlichii MLHE-1]
MPIDYAELHCLSCFSFLRGASQPAELVQRAAELGYRALALTDACSVAGAVRAHQAAKETDLHLIHGSEIRIHQGPLLVLLAPCRRAWAELCALISLGRSQARKGDYRLEREQLEGTLPHCLALWVPDDAPHDAEQGRWFARHFGDRGHVAVALHHGPDDEARLQRLLALADRFRLPAVAAGGVLMHRRGRRALQDTLSALRHRRTLAAMGTALECSGERHLRSLHSLARLYPPALLRRSVHLADQCRFSLDKLRYEYPAELVPAGETPASYLRRLTLEGARRHWPQGMPDKVAHQVDHELALIAEMGYEPFFLTVHDVVAFARRRGILCQGRGSSANSAVCFCLGITAVDPARQSLLFERFISKERGEPPDIDVDFEHERREEVIQYIYRKYGRHRAALAATVIRYRPRSALRDAGRALGLDAATIDRLAGSIQWWDGKRVDPERLREAGLNPDDPRLARTVAIAGQLLGLPRHLSQHVGGFVISEGPISELVPTENAAMAGRTIIQWDKDDLEALGLLKVDVLALGMLSCIRRAFDLLAGFRGRRLTLADVPAEDPAVYRMISDADTMGVFQIESRAQMAMLPRLRPQTFYDLVIEVAIVRPGPIQGDMVHPYLRRREGLEPVDYPSEAVRGVLARTLGVPIFQEQVMQLAVVAAGFTPGEADALRRAMAAWKRKGGLGPFRDKLLKGMRRNGYCEDYAERLFRQIQGFGEYGFPESHAASFALLVYVSAWLKCHEPALFTCALLNSQPMGFYAPAQLLRDAERHGVEIRPVDVRHSDWDCSPEHRGDGEPALRLGLRLVRGLNRRAADRLIAARGRRPFRDVQEMARRAALHRRDLETLAHAGALRGLAGHRRAAWWQVLGAEAGLPVFEDLHIEEAAPALDAPAEGEDLVADYTSLGFTLGRHPLALLRPQLRRRRLLTAADLASTGHGRLVRTAGLVINRQRPGSAGGVTFLTLEDETGQINLVVWKATAEAQRRTLLAARLLMVSGIWERKGAVTHLVAGRLEDWSDWLGALDVRSRDFH